MMQKWHLPIIKKTAVPVGVFQWLTHPGSLTARLENHFSAPVSVECLSESFIRCPGDYARILQIRAGSRVWRREVYLFCSSARVVHAITLIPDQTLQDWARPLRFIRNRPLGHLLFNMRGIFRSKLRISFRDGNWCRYSLFSNNQTALLVEEHFLGPFFHEQEAS